MSLGILSFLFFDFLIFFSLASKFSDFAGWLIKITAPLPSLFINEKTLSISSYFVPINKLNRSFLLCEEFILTKVDSFLDIVPFVNAK